MIRNIVVCVALCALALVLQATLLQGVAIFKVVPDLSLIVLLFASLKNGSMTGQVAGFASGLIQDFISSAPLGFNALIRTAIGFGFGALSGKLFIDRIIFPFLFGAVASLAKALLIGLLSLIFPEQIMGYDLGDKVFWIEMGYNAALSPLVFFLLGLFKRNLVAELDRS